MGKASLLSSKAHTRLRSLFDLVRDKGKIFNLTMGPPSVVASNLP